MSVATRELVARGVLALGRSSLWWAVGLVAYVVLNAAFWPSLEGTEALASYEDMGEVLDAFGAQSLGTPAGYLDGQVYALMLPLLLSGMAVAAATGLTAGDEAAGRLECLLALPVRRSQVWLARWSAVVAAVLLVAAVSAAAMVAVLPAFSLDGVSASQIGMATLGCTLLALFHGAVGFAASGLGTSRGTAVGTAVLVLVTGYCMSLLLPIADAFTGARQWSPWHWALDEQPVTDGPSVVGLVLVAVVTAALVVGGAVAVERRDIRSA
jgi:ABC-2 type transport system permease protein